MTRLYEEIEFSIKLLRENGLKEDNLRIVPVCHIRCLVPCQVGHCVCVGHIDNGRFCVATEDGYNRSMRCKHSELDYLQYILNNQLNNKIDKND